MHKRLLWVGLLLACSPSLWAQPTDTLAEGEPSLKFVLVPYAFYAPETKWGGGVAGVYTFRFPQESDRSQASQIQFGAGYTQLKQVLLYLSGRVYWQEDDYLAYGEAGYYIYNYFFYGTGNHEPPDFSELYGVTFPRVIANVLKRVSEPTYLGLRYGYDGYHITEVASGGYLAADTLAGSLGGVVSAIGPVVNYDTRDNIYFPRSGLFWDASLRFHPQWLGNTHEFTKLSSDLAGYHALPWQHTLAWNAYTEFNFGTVPFYQMAAVGGTRKLRGYYIGRYRADHMVLGQVEYRAPIWWRIGLTAFMGTASLAPSLSQLSTQNLRWSYGSGFRFMFDLENQVNLRFDAGKAPNEPWAFYITVGEAF